MLKPYPVNIGSYTTGSIVVVSGLSWERLATADCS